MDQNTVTMTRADYDALIDARDHAQAMRAVAGGAETLSDSDLDAFLAAPSPLAFWRKRRKLTQTTLARAAGITQPYLAQIERGIRVGDVALYSRLARSLNVRIEDLLADPTTAE